MEKRERERELRPKCNRGRAKWNTWEICNFHSNGFQRFNLNLLLNFIMKPGRCTFCIQYPTFLTTRWAHSLSDIHLSSRALALPSSATHIYYVAFTAELSCLQTHSTQSSSFPDKYLTGWEPFYIHEVITTRRNFLLEFDQRAKRMNMRHMKCWHRVQTLITSNNR